MESRSCVEERHTLIHITDSKKVEGVAFSSTGISSATSTARSLIAYYFSSLLTQSDGLLTNMKCTVYCVCGLRVCAF